MGKVAARRDDPHGVTGWSGAVLQSRTMNAPIETIAALATPPGESGLAVVRLSGPGCRSILADIFRRMDGDALADPGHRRTYHGRIVSNNIDIIDEVMVSVMLAPESYTGEDVIEISCHGGPVGVSRLLDTIYEAGAMAAEPGEFTKRAFLNGKIDLIQAEAVADIIHSRSELQHRVAQRQLEGGLSQRINVLADETVDLLAIIEANIDFIEEGIDTVNYDDALATLADQVVVLEGLLESAPMARRFHGGYPVVIAGPVNAGKSSLFNRLAGERRAIVTETPGTTRDVLRESIVLEGLLFLLQDTAGLRRDTADPVEAMGVDLAAEAVARADLVLFVIDGSERPGEDVAAALRGLDDGRTLVVVNKSDLPPHPEVNSMIGCAADLETVVVSAESGDGLAELQKALVRKVGGETLSRIARERFVLNTRLATLLDRARRHILELESGLQERKPLELLAEDARAVLAAYEEATGRRYSDGLLDAIFSRFCLGK